MVEIREGPIEDALTAHSTVPEFDSTKIADQFAERCSGKDPLIVLGYVDDVPVGYLIGYDRDNDGSYYCWMIGVHPDYRKQGITKAMMAYQEKWARKKGYAKLKIKTRNTRRAMLANLVKQGYHFMEVIQKEDLANNTIFMEKQLESDSTTVE